MNEFGLAVIGVAVCIVFSELYVRLSRYVMKRQEQSASLLIARQIEREVRQAAGKAPSLSGPAKKGWNGKDTRRHTILDMAERRKQASR